MEIVLYVKCYPLLSMPFSCLFGFFLLIVLCNNRDRLALFAMYDMEKFDYCTFVSLNHSAPL